LKKFLSNFFGNHWNSILDQKNSKYQKAVSRFVSRHNSSFNLMVFTTKSDNFYFQVFTFGLLKCDFLKLNNKISKICFRQKNRNIFLRLFSNVYCILKFNLGGVVLWRAKTLLVRENTSPKFENVLPPNNEHYCFRGSCQVWLKWYASSRWSRTLKFDYAF
jgi:hypothetical protein